MPLQPHEPSFPSQVDHNIKFFDRFATYVAKFTSKAVFFLACLFSVIIWAPSIFLIRDVDTWQLIINTGTTIVTFLLVALLQNTQTRDTNAIHIKLNAMADGMADFMESFQHQLSDNAEAKDLQKDIDELRAAVGVEHRESS